MSEYGWADTDWGATDPAGAWQHKYEVEREKNAALLARLAEAEALLEEARISVASERAYSDYEPRVKYLTNVLSQIDAFLSPDSATHRENERA